MAGTSPAKTKLAGEFPPLAAAKIFPRTALRLRGGPGRGDRLRGLALYAESKTAPGVPVDQAVGHFGAHSGEQICPITARGAVYQPVDRSARGAPRTPRSASSPVAPAAITANRQALKKICGGGRPSVNK